MRTLTYTQPVTRRVFDLNTDILRVPRLTELRTTAWDYTLTGRRATKRMRKAKTYTMTINSRDPEQLDEFIKIADADFANNTPGTLMVDGQWYQHCFIVDAKATGTVIPTLQQVELTLILLDGVWRRENIKTIIPPSAAAVDSGYLGYPHDYPYMYTKDIPRPVFDNTVETSTAVGLRFYGLVTNPSVLINGNNYQVDVTVPDGSYLEVNPISEPPTVQLVDNNGVREDVFAQAHIGEGLNSGDYIFEPVEPGAMEVSYTADMSFDVILYEERSALPWNTLN